MICTCDNCHYTFEAESLPLSCPDCGKEKINRRIGDKIKSAPAVRPATSDEIAWYEENQMELAAEAEQKRQLQSVETYDMTDEEYNWAMVMVHEKPTPKTDEARELTQSFYRSASHDPEKLLEHYLQIRKQFTGKISEDRAALRKTGKHEPFLVAQFSGEEPVLIDGLDQYGSALCVLYHFKPYDFLHTPTLGDLRRIDLKRIAEEPSAGFSQFLLDWLNSL